MRNRQDINELFSSTPRAQSTAAPTGPQEGKIIAVANGKATFIVPDYSDTALFGPAPYAPGIEPPPVGAKCLIVFVGNGVDRAWIVAWEIES